MRQANGTIKTHTQIHITPKCIHRITKSMPYINFKNEILPFETIEMDLESVMLCEKRQTNTVCFHLYVKFKKIKQMNNKTETDSQI